MPEPTLAQLLDRLVLIGVAITTRALAEATPGYDLTFPQWRAMVIVGECSEGATVSEVASRVGVTVPATSRQLRRLADRGLLEVGPDDVDRRATRARLTARGLEARNAILAFRRERITRVASNVRVSAITRRDLARVVEVFEIDR